MQKYMDIFIVYLSMKPHAYSKTIFNIQNEQVLLGGVNV